MHWRTSLRKQQSNRQLVAEQTGQAWSGVCSTRIGLVVRRLKDLIALLWYMRWPHVAMISCCDATNSDCSTSEDHQVNISSFFFLQRQLVVPFVLGVFFKKQNQNQRQKSSCNFINWSTRNYLCRANIALWRTIKIDYSHPKRSLWFFRTSGNQVLVTKTDLIMWWQHCCYMCWLS